MSDPERFRAQAQEAERMASVVSYGRDRERLLRQAAEWRDRAAALEAGRAVDEGPPDAPAGPRPSLPRWMRTLLGQGGRRED